MHESSFALMGDLLTKYVQVTFCDILDVGSAVIWGGPTDNYPDGLPLRSGTYRSACMPGWSYVGLDISAGPNVDIIATDSYHWPIRDESFDVVISGQCIEHVPELRAWMAEIFRCCRPGGRAIVIGPSAGPYHAIPVHCWLIMKDGMRWLLETAGFEILEVDQWDKHPFNDCWGVGKKP